MSVKGKITEECERVTPLEVQCEKLYVILGDTGGILETILGPTPQADLIEIEESDQTTIGRLHFKLRLCTLHALRIKDEVMCINEHLAE